MFHRFSVRVIFLALFAFFCAWVGVLPVQAATITVPFSSLQAVVWVQCGNRQGSGSVINGQEGYVLTNAHVVANVETKNPPEAASSCVVGFLSAENQTKPKIFYHSSIVRWSFDPERGQDFAILQIGKLLSSTGIDLPFPMLETNEFPVAGERMEITAYSGGDTLSEEKGTIADFDSGFIVTTAVIRPGNSGGAGLNADFRLIGMPTRIVTVSETGQPDQIHYELVDIRAVMNWLDGYGPNEHDRFFTHENAKRFHENAIFLTQTNLGCAFLGRGMAASTVFCFLPGDERLVFPNEATFLSWFPGFATVDLLPTSLIAPYRITRNVTYRPGSLVKSATSPHVYLVVNAFGTLRFIPDETSAQRLWGPNWTASVHDVPDEFWGNYQIGPPLEISGG